MAATRTSDTIRRTKYLRSKGMLYVGRGVSGGEEGARFGPSMSQAVAQGLAAGERIFQAIAARLLMGSRLRRMGEDARAITSDGPQRYRVRRHATYLRGIPVLKEGLGMSNEEMHGVLTEWNKGESTAT